MMGLFDGLLIIFAIVGVVSVAAAYYPIVKDIRKEKRVLKDAGPEDATKDVQRELEILKGDFKPKKKAAAIVELMRLSYILVHVMVNKGNNYNDKLQSERFLKSLTPELMVRLKEVEGRYE